MGNGFFLLILSSTSAVQRKAAASALFNTVNKGPTGIIKSVLDTQRTDGGRRDEIFVDIVERISCTFNQTGYVTASQIDGAIQVELPLSELSSLAALSFV